MWLRLIAGEDFTRPAPFSHVEIDYLGNYDINDKLSILPM